jgi:predicted ATP-grasp superfamily ATP-dependent carboligase
MRVLVTDAGFKNALCAIRNLGQHGCEVMACAPGRASLGFLSRHCAKRLICPSPYHHPEEFVAWVADVMEREGIDVALPIGDASTVELSRYKDRLQHPERVPIADWPSMSVAASKSLTLGLATRLGVPVPRTYERPEEVERFPVVVKASKGSGRVRYVNSTEELAASGTSDVVIQEYIPGEGWGFFGLFDHGQLVAKFMHRRLREYPVTGGASTAAESAHDPQLEDLGLRLLNELHWHGVAMVEFKKDARDGQYRLMEINPKFWGSLDLAIAAGVEFPWLTVRLAVGDRFLPVLQYPVGVRFHWFFDDVLHALAKPTSIPAVLGACLDSSVRSDLQWSDPGPSVARGFITAAQIVKRLCTGSFRHPHGAPQAFSIAR